jgi:hypothetical protein
MVRDGWLERLGYVYISCIYLCLLTLAIAISLNGYPIALVIFGLGGMVATGYGLIRERQGRSSFFRTFVERCAKHSKKKGADRTTNCKLHAIPYNRLHPCFIDKFCYWLIACHRTKPSQDTQEKTNQADSKQDAQEFPHSQPPEDEK